MNNPPLSANYRAQAENIVATHFLEFEEAKKEEFFSFFRQICPENSSVYTTLHQQYANFQQREKKLTSQHKYYLLLAMPPFLPTDAQCKLLQCELFDAVQRYRKYHKQGSFIFLWEENVWEAYEKYINKIYLLQNHALQWFAPNAFEAQDQQEVVEAIKYVCLQEADEAMQNFERDVQAIRAQSHTALTKLRYKESFFGLSIKVTRTSTRQASDYAPQDLAMPVLVGKFARDLQNVLY